MNPRATGTDPRRSRRGMTLAELMIALSITCLVGAGVVAMTESVGRVLVEGRVQKENTIASATAASRLSMVVSASNCILMLSPDLVVCWGADTRRDGRIQASELSWIRFDQEQGTMHLDQVAFPDDFGPRDEELADPTLETDEDFQRTLATLTQGGLVDSRLLLDGLREVELSMSDGDLADPLQQKRVSWRLNWSEGADAHAETIITCGVHAHARPEEF